MLLAIVTRPNRSFLFVSVCQCVKKLKKCFIISSRHMETKKGKKKIKTTVFPFLLENT